MSRQRFWGCPIPIVYCEDGCGAQPVPDDQLPVVAPDDVEFVPTGQSPLQFHEGFLHTTCPSCGGPARRETDTMDTFVDSSWYFMRFCDPWVERTPFRADEVAQVDAGRPVHRRCRARRAAPHVRPLLHQGAGRPRHRAGRASASRSDDSSPRARSASAGRAMSKSKGNLVTPEEIIDTLGADALRLAQLAVKPPAEDVDWEDLGLEGCARFLNRVWRLAVPGTDLPTAATGLDTSRGTPTTRWMRLTHQLIVDFTEAFDRWSYNVAVARCMAFVNELYRYVQSDDGPRGRDAGPRRSTPCCCCWHRRHPT